MKGLSGLNHKTNVFSFGVTGYVNELPGSMARAPPVERPYGEYTMLSKTITDSQHASDDSSPQSYD